MTYFTALVCQRRGLLMVLAGTLFATLGTATVWAQETEAPLTDAEMKAVREFENVRVQLINQVVGSVVAIYGPSRQGGGSGVIIDPSGIALTNHHVIEGAGMRGFGGLNVGKLYDWELIGTDPGGDVAVIKLKGRDAFPWAPLGNSDKVKVGDWALAMGNPFLLAKDQVPTVTLGVVSGVERFQEGQGTQLVYGNCIQIDSSINPGNSGGPLFDMQGHVIGINGRGSFRDRGRVNVGLGYAISINQIKNFLPDLLATKIVEHGTLDASFSNRGGKVICSTLDLDSAAAVAGLELGDELLEFEGQSITHANQFKNLICTYPEDWPADLQIRKPDGQELRFQVRLFGLPYDFRAPAEAPAPDEQPSPGPPQDDAEKDAEKGPGETPDSDGKPGVPNESGLLKHLMNESGVSLNAKLNGQAANRMLDQWQEYTVVAEPPPMMWQIEDEVLRDQEKFGTQKITVSHDGRFRVDWQTANEKIAFLFDGEKFWEIDAKQTAKELDLVEAKMEPRVTQAMAIVAALQAQPFKLFGNVSLDGSDKTQGALAGRLIWLDEDDDWFFAWFSLYDESGKPQVVLRKIASDKNCQGGNRGLLLNDYREVGGVRLPETKHVVSGLNETIEWTAKTLSIEPREVDSTLFTLPSGSRQ